MLTYPGRRPIVRNQDPITCCDDLLAIPIPHMDWYGRCSHECAEQQHRSSSSTKALNVDVHQVLMGTGDATAIKRVAGL